MTRDETKQILMGVQVAYPNYKTPDKTLAVDFWHRMLQDQPYDLISAALQVYIRTDTSGFAPSIGQLLNKATGLRKHISGEPPEISDMEAWGLVYKAITRSGWYADSEFLKLPQSIRRAVGCPDNLREWASMDIETVQSVVQSNFLRTYRAQKEYEEKESAVRDALEAIAGGKIGLLEEAV